MRTILITACAPIIWGSTYLLTGMLDMPGHPLFIGAMRALPIGLLLVAAQRQRPAPGAWPRLLALGALNIGLFFALFFVAAARLPGGVAATISATQPFMVTLLLWPLLGLRPRARALDAAALGAAGVATLALGPGARLDPLGAGAAALGALAMALGTALAARWGGLGAPLATTGWQLLIGGATLLPLALWREGAPPALAPAALGIFAALGLIHTGLAYALWFRGLERLSPATASMLQLLTPLVATLIDAALLGRPLGIAQALGGALVLGGLALHAAGPACRTRPPVRY